MGRQRQRRRQSALFLVAIATGSLVVPAARHGLKDGCTCRHAGCAAPTGVRHQDLCVLDALGLPHADALVQNEALIQERVLHQKQRNQKRQVKWGGRREALHTTATAPMRARSSPLSAAAPAAGSRAPHGSAPPPGTHLDGAPRLLDDLNGVQVGAALQAQHSIHRQLSKVVLLCMRDTEAARRGGGEQSRAAASTASSAKWRFPATRDGARHGRAVGNGTGCGARVLQRSLDPASPGPPLAGCSAPSFQAWLPPTHPASGSCCSAWSWQC